jgi:hypothetical protein
MGHLGAFFLKNPPSGAEGMQAHQPGENFNFFGNMVENFPLITKAFSRVLINLKEDDGNSLIKREIIKNDFIISEFKKIIDDYSAKKVQLEDKDCIQETQLDKKAEYTILSKVHSGLSYLYENIESHFHNNEGKSLKHMMDGATSYIAKDIFCGATYLGIYKVVNACMYSNPIAKIIGATAVSHGLQSQSFDRTSDANSQKYANPLTLGVITAFLSVSYGKVIKGGIISKTVGLAIKSAILYEIYGVQPMQMIAKPVMSDLNNAIVEQNKKNAGPDAKVTYELCDNSKGYVDNTKIFEMNFENYRDYYFPNEI